MYWIGKLFGNTPEPDPEWTAEDTMRAVIHSILATACEEDTDIVVQNPENENQVHIFSQNGELWIDGERVG
jgi:hypothetical protein